MKEFKIVTVCGAGVGTSTLLRSNLNSVIKDMNLDFNVHVENTSLSRAKGTRCDLFVTFPTFEKDFKDSPTDYILIKNLMDKKELKEKLTAYFAQVKEGEYDRSN